MFKLKAEAGREDGHSVVFWFGGREDLQSAGERGSALSAHRPVRRQPQGLLSHRHSSALVAGQDRYIGYFVCAWVC